MATCPDCEQEMTTAASCTVDAVILQGERFPRHRVRRPIGPADRCGDCGVQRGGFHHLGCDLERCPCCGGQMISCGCSWADEETEAVLAVVGDLVVYPPHLRGLQVPTSRFPFGGGDREDHPR